MATKVCTKCREEKPLTEFSRRKTRSCNLVEPRLLSARDVARFLSVSRAFLYKLRESAQIPTPIRLGGRVLWSREELEAWIDKGCPQRKKWEARRSQYLQRMRERNARCVALLYDSYVKQICKHTFNFPGRDVNDEAIACARQYMINQRLIKEMKK